MDVIFYILLIALAYLMGSIPFAAIISKIKGINIQKTGSGNPGAANVTGHVGKIYGIFVFLLDASKAAIPVFLLYRYTYVNQWFIVAFSIAFIIGHDWSIFLKFSGGKGVSTSIGIAIVLFPLGYIIVFPLFLILFIIRKETNFGSFLFFLLSPVATYFLYKNSMFTALSSLIFLIYIVRRVTYIKSFSVKTVFNRIVFDHD